MSTLQVIRAVTVETNIFGWLADTQAVVTACSQPQRYGKLWSTSIMQTANINIQLIEQHVSTTVLFMLYKVRLHVSTIHVVILRSLISFKFQRAAHTCVRSPLKLETY